MIRSAASFNIDGLIVKERHFPSESKLLYKSASGCVEHLNIFQVSNINTTLKYLRDKNFWVYSANPGNIKKPTNSHPIVQSYVDLFIGGCFQIKERYKINEFPKQCVETTTEWSKHWVNDRVHARRPFLVPNFYKIDKLLSNYFDYYLENKYQ